jgi:hypothetical protein
LATAKGNIAAVWAIPAPSTRTLSTKALAAF